MNKNEKLLMAICELEFKKKFKRKMTKKDLDVMYFTGGFICGALK